METRNAQLEKKVDKLNQDLLRHENTNVNVNQVTEQNHVGVQVGKLGEMFMSMSMPTPIQIQLDRQAN